MSLTKINWVPHGYTDDTDFAFNGILETIFFNQIAGIV